MAASVALRWGGPFPAPEGDVDCIAHVEGNAAMVKLKGRFTFEDQATFKATVLPLLTVPELRDVRLDLQELTYLDASALGALLILRERTMANGQRLVLQHPRKDVRSILELVKFDRLFPIED